MTSNNTIKLMPEKITQIQCEDCNRSLHQQFIYWLNDSFKYLPNFLSKFYMEIEVLMSFVEYRFSISINKPQPGDFLQNIQFNPLTTKKKLLWLLLSVVLPYVKGKLTLFASQKQLNSEIWRKIARVLSIIEKLVAVMEFINYAIFILKGQFRNLTQRVLGINMKFINQNNKRILNFSLMNRMLIWQIYELCLKTILPQLFAVAGSSLKNVFFLSSYMKMDEKMDKQKCMYCGSMEVVMPIKIKGCDHKACYYCQKANDKEQKCKACGKVVDEWIILP